MDLDAFDFQYLRYNLLNKLSYVAFSSTMTQHNHTRIKTSTVETRFYYKIFIVYPISIMIPLKKPCSLPRNQKSPCLISLHPSEFPSDLPEFLPDHS